MRKTAIRENLPEKPTLDVQSYSKVQTWQSGKDAIPQKSPLHKLQT
jgi:hypothetical protein